MTASDRVRREWGNRIEAEYRSAAITHHLTLWLIQVGMSPDLIRDGLRIVDDELAHAELAHAVYAEAGGTEPLALDRGTLGLSRNHDRPLELDITRWGVQVFCLGETVAVPLFAHLRADCTVPCARQALDRVLRDEVRHRQFGWDLLDHLLELPDAEVIREQVARDLPGMFAGLERSYGEWNAGQRPANDIDDDDRTWGLAPASEYAAILHATFAKEYAPRFEERDIDAGPAWDHRLELLESQLARS